MIRLHSRNPASLSASGAAQNRRTLAVAGALLVLVFLAAVISVGAGDMFIRPDRVLGAIFGTGNEAHVMVVQKLRLPRILTGLLAGAALAGSGAILQGVLRNPMASPDIIGVTGGASVAAVMFLTYGIGLSGIGWLPVFAFTGGVLVSVLLYVLAWKNGASPVRLILIGIGISSLTSAGTTMMIIFNPRNDAAMAYVWMTGSVYAANWTNVATILPWVAVLLPLAFLYARHVNISLLGDETAISAGSPVESKRRVLLLISVGLAASAVSVAGNVGFVGLLAPHMARRLVGSNFARLLPVSVLLGALTVLLADLAGRTFFLPLDVPVGVFTSMVGAPFFIYLLYRNRNK